jgi:hypothetical protein
LKDKGRITGRHVTILKTVSTISNVFLLQTQGTHHLPFLKGKCLLIYACKELINLLGFFHFLGDFVLNSSNPYKDLN